MVAASAEELLLLLLGAKAAAEATNEAKRVDFMVLVMKKELWKQVVKAVVDYRRIAMGGCFVVGINVAYFLRRKRENGREKCSCRLT
jgi:hypothetical protein